MINRAEALLLALCAVARVAAAPVVENAKLLARSEVVPAPLITAFNAPLTVP
jgi:hypothetical protein